MAALETAAAAVIFATCRLCAVNFFMNFLDKGL